MSGAAAAMCGGGSFGLDQQTITCGQDGAVGARRIGFISGVLGSLSDGTSNIYSGAAITELYWDQAGSSLTLSISGLRANSGWTTMTRIGSANVYSRASAAYSQVGGVTTWEWVTAESHAMGSDGSTSTVVFQ